MKRRTSVPIKNGQNGPFGQVEMQMPHINATPSAAAVLRAIQASYGKPSFALPLWQIKPSVQTYMVDDAVDGLYKLSNGTQRWYPARITAVNADSTYVLQYLDGDIHPNKESTEIRLTKNWKLSSRSSRTSISSTDGSTQRDSGMPMNCVSTTPPPMIGQSPFRSSSMRKRSFKDTASLTPRLKGVVEHSESCTPPMFKSGEFYEESSGSHTPSKSYDTADDGKNIFVEVVTEIDLEVELEVEKVVKLDQILECESGRSLEIGMEEIVEKEREKEREKDKEIDNNSNSDDRIEREQEREREKERTEDQQQQIVTPKIAFEDLCIFAPNIEITHAIDALGNMEKMMDKMDRNDCVSESGKSNFSDISVHSASTNPSCKQTFAIPSVFDTPRTQPRLEGKR